MERHPDNIDFARLLREGSSVYMFGEQRVFCSRYVAVITRVENERLFLRLDPEDMRKARVAAGAKVLLGFAVSEHRMYFGAPVEVLDLEESGVVVVTYPRGAKKWPRRAYVRAALAVPCELTLPGDRELQISGRSVNLSASGALIDLEEPIPRALLESANGQLKLAFTDRPPVSFGFTVVRVIEHERDPKMTTRIAVKYSDIPEVDEMQIQLLVLRTTARRFLRAEVSLPCTVELYSEGTAARKIPGVTENMSGVGVYLRLNERVDAFPGQRMPLELAFPDRRMMVPDAEVARVHHDKDRTCVGVDYSDLKQLDREYIVRFVVAQIRSAPDSVLRDGAGSSDPLKPSRSGTSDV